MNKFVSNVIELFTPYKLSEAADPQAIAEREYASAAEIQFTEFTSCIGVIAKEGSTLTAIHLVASTGKNHVFNTIDAVNVKGRLPKNPDAVTIVGYIDIWRNLENGNLAKAFEKLTTLFKKIELQQGGGKLRAKIDGAGQIQVNNAWF